MKITHTININDYIKVKLTDKGKDIYYDYYVNYYQEEDYIYKNTACEAKVDINGYTKMQLHEFMQIFGNRIPFGYNDIFENNNIIIGEEEYDI